MQVANLVGSVYVIKIGRFLKRAKTAKTSPFHPFNSDAQKECPALFSHCSLFHWVSGVDRCFASLEFQDLKRRVCSLESSLWLHIDRKGRKIPSWDYEGIHHFYSCLIINPQIIQIRYSDIRRILSEGYEEMFSCSLAGCYSYFSISKCQAGGVVRFFGSWVGCMLQIQNVDQFILTAATGSVVISMLKVQ